MATIRRRQQDGAGKGKFSWRKHEMIREVIRAQVSILNLEAKPGVIIDMHAGDGEGVDLPQPDFWLTPLSQSTPFIALETAEQCTPIARVILCERDRSRRELLTGRFGARATILADHEQLLNESLQGYRWIVVMNDPNGHSDHGVDVLQGIVQQNARSDLLIMVNEGSINRHLSLAPNGDEHGTESARVRGSREAMNLYRWMYDAESQRVDARAWAEKLWKQHALISRRKSSNHAYQGRLLLLANKLANLNDRRYERIV